MNTLSSIALTAALAVLTANEAPAAQLDPDILVVIESPRDAMSGISLVNGYALSKKGAIDYVTWSVDGDAKGFVPYGGSRGDVEAAYPGYADSKDPGFATAWNYNHFAPGEHEITVRAYDDRGGYNEAKKKFNTARFGDGADKFLRADEIELQRIPITSLRIHPADPSGNLFDVQLVWSKAAQQYTIESIELTCGQCGKPGYAAPTLVSANIRNDQSTEIRWTGGDSVVAYQIESRPPMSLVGSPWTYVGTAAGTEDRFIAPAPPSGGGVIALLNLDYRVRGLGAADKTAWSNPVLSTPQP